MAISNESEYYSVAEAARILGVSPSTIWRWVDARHLPAVRLGPRRIRIRKEDLEAMVRPARPVEPPSTPRWEIHIPPPTPEELARRREAVDRILANRERRNIAPLTTADLVRMAREWKTTAPDE